MVNVIVMVNCGEVGWGEALRSMTASTHEKSGCAPESRSTSRAGFERGRGLVGKGGLGMVWWGRVGDNDDDDDDDDDGDDDDDEDEDDNNTNNNMIIGATMAMARGNGDEGDDDDR